MSNYPKAAPWGDWREIPLAGAFWRNGAALGGVDVIDVNEDQLDDANQQEDLKGGATLKPTFARPSGELAVPLTVELHYQIPVPDGLLFKQQRNLSSWDGLIDSDMGAGDQGRRRYLWIQTILTSVAEIAAVLTYGEDLDLWAASVKFRGYGADTDPTNPGNDQTAAHQDAPVTGDTIGVFGGVSVFGDMEIPSNPGTNTSRVSFADTGMARIITVVEVPATVQPGDVAEFIGRITIPVATTAQPDVQWYGTQYKWVTDPLPLLPNQSLQVFGQEADGRTQLQEQSRDDIETSQP